MREREGEVGKGDGRGGERKGWGRKGRGRGQSPQIFWPRTAPVKGLIGAGVWLLGVVCVAAGDGDVVVVHGAEEKLERRSLGRYALPAHQHYVVQLVGAVPWLSVSLAALQIVERLRVIHLCHAHAHAHTHTMTFHIKQRHAALALTLTLSGVAIQVA